MALNNQTPDVEKQMQSCLKLGRSTDFEQFYDYYSPMVTGLVTRMVAHERVGILVHKAFAFAWSKRELYDPKNVRVLTWMVKLTREIIQQHQSIRVTEVPQFSFLENTNEIYDVQQQKYIFDRVFYRGESLFAISNELNITENTLKAMLKKAVSHLNQNGSYDVS